MRRLHIHHALEALVRQRVFQIACGYEEQNDADTVRSAPLLKLVCGRRPEQDAAVASPSIVLATAASTRHRMSEASASHASPARLSRVVQQRINEGRLLELRQGVRMGLHISRTIVERHGGQVGVESVSGHGATFWFTLPLVS